MAQQAVMACLITNPKSGRGGVDLSEALTVLRAHGWDSVVRQKLHGGHATELAAQAVREGFNVVVDCGGDGTLNEIIEGVVGTGAAVGTLPGGTANLWAHEVGISAQLRVAALQLVGAERRRVDVGRVAVNGNHKHHFLLMAGVGFDGAVIQRVNKPLKNRIGPLAIGLAALEALPQFHAVPVRVEMDGVHWQGRVSQVIVGNTRRYAGFTRITPDAFADDGMLDICLLTTAGPIRIARQLTTLALRQRPSASTAELYRAASVWIHAPVVLPLQVDGGSVRLEADECTADGVVYTFSLVTQGVSMLVPRTYNGELFQPTRVADNAAETPLEPVPVLHHLENGSGHRATDGGNGHKQKSWELKVLAVGVSSLTAARMKDGRVVHVGIDTDTALEDGAGKVRPLWGALSTLSEGDHVQVTGYKDRQNGMLCASRVALNGQHAKKGH